MTFLFQEGQKKVCVWGEAAGVSFTKEVREHAHELVETSRDENEMVDVDMGVQGSRSAWELVDTAWQYEIGDLGGGSTASDSERYRRSGIHYKVKNVEMQDVENCCVKDKCVFRDVKFIFR